MNKSTEKEVQFNLIGGLGNQLFIYFAGQYYQQLRDVPVRFNLSTIGTGGTFHGKSILDLNVQGKFMESKDSKTFSYRNKFISRLTTKSRLLKSLYDRVSHVYISPETGYDKNLLSISSKSEVNGYFQSWRYVAAIDSAKIDNLRLTKPSEWYLKTAKEILSSNPIVIHLRLGDYLDLVDTFGILSWKYYHQALMKVEGYTCREIWVFSNDLDLARIHLAPLRLKNLKYVSPNHDSSATESMLLMSLAQDLIIGNSTFSWWSAKLGNISKNVYAPKVWFKQIPEPHDLIPDEWERIESDWA
jgi:hypothetical protein